MNTFDDILKINELVKKRKELDYQIQSLSIPQLTNLNRVQLMYDEVCNQLGVASLKKSNKDAFIFVMYALFDPQALSGNKHRGKIKRHLAKLFNVAPNTIFPSKLLLFFQRYDDFRNLATRILSISLSAC
jgi:hypothetical protein